MPKYALACGLFLTATSAFVPLQLVPLHGVSIQRDGQITSGFAVRFNRRMQENHGRTADLQLLAPLQELHSEHGGAKRIVWQANTMDWLDGTVDLDKLPQTYNIITSLPDVSELATRRRRVSPAEYEEFFVEVVRKILLRLPPEKVAIFYQTPGRTTGVGGEWLDKGETV